MTYIVDYKGFIENFFYIKTKEGQIVPFIFNEVQNAEYESLKSDYGAELQGVRENDLKGRQFGFSSLITGIFTVDFILAAVGEIPLVDGAIYSHKDKETTAHFNRVNMFVESWMLKTQGGDYGNPEHRAEVPKLRPHFFKIDTTNRLVAKNGVEIQTATAGAKVSGRGGTLQNLHWSEVAFYPNTPILSAETLVTGAEEQVPEGYGKIFRETTGNMAGDFFSKEYYLGKEGKSDFRSRFHAWYLHKPYTAKDMPADWEAPEYYRKLLNDNLATREQCYWHYKKTRQLTNKKRMREYPTYDHEAFLMAGTGFFDDFAMLWHQNNVIKPGRSSMYVNALY